MRGAETKGIVMALSTEHMPASAPINPATFPRPGSHQWRIWWFAVLAALAAGTTGVVTIVADSSNHNTDRDLVGYTSADAVEHRLGAEASPRPIVAYRSADTVEHRLGAEASPRPIVAYRSADTVEHQ